MPSFRQLFVDDPDGATGIDLDRKLFVVRKRCEHEIAGELAVYFPSLSSRTLVYKGMLTTPQLGEFFPDLADERVESALALVHSRFSTNTFPSWPLAHPYRYVAHNGEINTRAGQPQLDARPRGADGRRRSSPASSARSRSSRPARPTPPASTSASSCCTSAGRPIWHAVLMMIPEAWENHATMSPEKRAFYRFHASLMEPWDGPASIAFTDGTVDRRGARPQRSAPEPLLGHRRRPRDHGERDRRGRRRPGAASCKKGRLQPGRMFLVDTAAGPHRRRRGDQGRASPPSTRTREWLEQGLVHLRRPARPRARRADATSRCCAASRRSATRTRSSSCWSRRWRKTGDEAIGSMGTDTPVAVLSDRPRLLFDYFQQLFAQVTNPPLDAIREELVTSLSSHHRPRGQPARAGPGVVRADRAAVPDHRQRRAGQAHPHRRRRRPARVSPRT